MPMHAEDNKMYTTGKKVGAALCTVVYLHTIYRMQKERAWHGDRQ